MKLETRLKRARKKIADGYAEVAAVQAECTHPDLTGKFDANTGNWCSQDDSYWIDLDCPLCGKRWTVYSDNDDYRHYGDQPWQKYKCKIIRK